MRNTDRRRTRILKYVLFSLGDFWLMRPDKVTPHPAHRNRMERTITQNGALYALHHRPTQTFQRNLQKRGRAALLRPLTTLLRRIVETTKRSTMAGKVQPRSVAPIRHIPVVFVDPCGIVLLVDEISCIGSF